MQARAADQTDIFFLYTSRQTFLNNDRDRDLAMRCFLEAAFDAVWENNDNLASLFDYFGNGLHAGRIQYRLFCSRYRVRQKIRISHRFARNINIRTIRKTGTHYPFAIFKINCLHQLLLDCKF